MEEIAKIFLTGKESLRSINYFIHMLYPRLKDKKVLEKIFLDIGKATKNLAEALLLYEQAYKRINVKGFSLDGFKKIAKRYLNISEIEFIEHCISKAELIQNSSVNFLKQNSYVAMKENGNFIAFSIDDAKQEFSKLQELYAKIEERLRKDLIMARYLEKIKSKA